MTVKETYLSAIAEFTDGKKQNVTVQIEANTSTQRCKMNIYENVIKFSVDVDLRALQGAVNVKR